MSGNGGILCKSILAWAKTNEEFDTKFVVSVKKQFEAKGKISPKQIQALQNIIKKFKIELCNDSDDSESEDEESESSDEETKSFPSRLVKWKDGETLE